MRKGKRNDELAYFCSGIPVTRARAQEIRSSSPIREDPLQMPSSPIILRSGKILKSPKPIKVDPREDPVCQLLSEILNKHRKTPPAEEILDLQQIMKPISARASTSADINPLWPSSALMGYSITADPLRIPPAKTGSSTFQIAGPSSETTIDNIDNPTEPQPPEISRFSIFKFAKPTGTPPEKPSPPRISSPGAKPPVSSNAPPTQQMARSARVIQACTSLLSDVLGRVESAMGVAPKSKSAIVVQKTPPQPDKALKEYKQTNSANVVSKPVKYVDRGTSPIDLVDLTPPEIPDEPIGDPGFRFKSVGSIHSAPCTVEPPRHIKTGPFTGWEEDKRNPIRTRSFRPQIKPSPPQRRRAISVPCSIL